MDKKKPDNQVQYMPIGMCLGISVGMAIGSAMDNISVGMCLGLGIGMCIGVAIDNANKAKQDDTKRKNSNFRQFPE